MALNFWTVGLLLLIATTGDSAPSAADAPSAKSDEKPANLEYLVKAGYLRHFGTFGTWPGTMDRFTIGVVGPDPFGSVLDQLAASQKIRNQIPIIIRRYPSLSVVEPCQILFVAAREELPAVLNAMRGKPVLIVTDQEGLAKVGAMVNFYLDVDGDAKKVKFEINLKRMEEAGLKMDARVVKMGRLIEESPSSGSVSEHLSP